MELQMMLHVSYSFIISSSDNATVKAIRWTSPWHKPFFPWRNRFNSGQKEVVKHVYLPFSVTCLYDLYFRKRNIEKIVEKQFIWREVTWKNVPRHTIVKGRLFSFVPKLSKKIAYFKVIMFLLRHACLSYQKYCCCSPYFLPILRVCDASFWFLL